jgi:hypothetical protein
MESRIKEETLNGLRVAIQADPANARLAAHLGRALADYALEKGINPAEAERARVRGPLCSINLVPKIADVFGPGDLCSRIATGSRRSRSQLLSASYCTDSGERICLIQA